MQNYVVVFSIKPLDIEVDLKYFKTDMEDYTLPLTRTSPRKAEI